MRRFSRRQTLHTLAEINVTPMLDLCFVLLVIFMITTPLLENSLDLAVPTSATATDPVEPDRSHVLSVDRQAAFQLDGQTVPPEALDDRLANLRREGGAELSLVIRAHRELSVQRFVSVMDALQRAGIARVGVVTQGGEPDPKTSAP